MAPPPSPLYPFELPTGVTAWYRPGEFSLSAGTWPDASGNGHTANFSGSGFASVYESGHGASVVIEPVQIPDRSRCSNSCPTEMKPCLAEL